MVSTLAVSSLLPSESSKQGNVGETANGMSEGLSLAMYFLICKETGEVPRYPSNEFFTNCNDDKSYAPSLADLSVYMATNPDAKNEAFNHANGDTIVWRYFFPRLGDYYGLQVRIAYTSSSWRY